MSLSRPLVAALAIALGAACTVQTSSSSGDPAPSPTTASEADASAASVDAGADAPADADASGPCEAPVGPVPASLGLPAFYAQYLDAAGTPVVASAKPSVASLRAACRIVLQMTSFRPDVRAKMIANKSRVAIIGKAEKTTDIPEYDFLKNDPNTDWNTRARGLGATLDLPLTTGAEENVLCQPQDPWHGENILVHELAHSMANLGASPVDATFQKRLDEAFAKAIAAGKWKNTYAATNAAEYWAEGVQDYFDDNLEAIPSNGIHNEINTRAELLAYDPALHALVAEVFGPAAWKPACP